MKANEPTKPSKKEGHDPSPVPAKEVARLDTPAGDEYGVFDAKQVKDPPAGQTAEPHAAEAPPEESLKKPKEPDGKVFKFQVRNSMVNVDGAIRAGSAKEAEKQAREWLCSGLVVKEG